MLVKAKLYNGFIMRANKIVLPDKSANTENAKLGGTWMKKIAQSLQRGLPLSRLSHIRFTKFETYRYLARVCANEVDVGDFLNGSLSFYCLINSLMASFRIL